jgi:hypothetical protein
MKAILRKAFLESLFLFSILIYPEFFASAVGNAEIHFAVTRVQTSVDETFQVKLLLEPKGSEVDTVRVNLSFAKELVEVDNVQLGSLFSEVSPGNTIDNINGSVSFGAFTLSGAVAVPGEIGTVTFKALKEGQGEISIESNSRLIYEGSERLNTQSIQSFSLEIGPKTEELKEIIIESGTHPDQGIWYNENAIEWSWKSSVPIKRYFVEFDNNPNTDPKKVFGSATLERSENAVPDGVWYFHVKGERENGTFAGVTRYKMQIDSTPPVRVSVNADDIQLAARESTQLWFAAIDVTSGIDHYEVAINELPFSIQESPMLLQNLKPGDYFIRVKAVDRGQNASYAETSVRVYEGGLLEDIYASEGSRIQKKIETLWISLSALLIISGIITIIIILRKLKKTKKQ